MWIEAITLDEEKIATVDEKMCTECGKCVEVCPSEAIEIR
jgi:NAD-dependent dihydropyrimidine dehydrogenase PreA subunit